MIEKMVLATGNQGKLRELQAMLLSAGQLPGFSANLELLAQKALGISDAEETGSTFVENAILKARHASAHAGLPAIADDSGLAVDYLQGAPGVFSARYAGPDASDEENNKKLLTALSGVPAEQRGAQFHCVIVLLRHADDPVPLICHGSWAGRILTEPAGDNGFGYDPLFWVPAHQCASAQLAPEAKNRISHRALAMQQLLGALAESASPPPAQTS